MIERRLAEAAAPNPASPVLGRARIAYEYAQRTRATAHGGMGMVARVVAEVGLAAEIDASVAVLAQHRPYHESDHVLNIAYNALCGGARLENIEARRNDAVFLDGIGAPSRPISDLHDTGPAPARPADRTRAPERRSQPHSASRQPLCACFRSSWQ